MKRGHVTSIYYYLNIVKMAASTVQMAAAIFVQPPVLFDQTGKRRVPGIEKQVKRITILVRVKLHNRDNNLSYSLIHIT